MSRQPLSLTSLAQLAGHEERHLAIFLMSMLVMIYLKSSYHEPKNSVTIRV